LSGLHLVLGRNVRVLRVEAGMRQEDVADEMNRIRPDLRTTRWTIANIEAGERKVDIDELPALAGALGATMADLLAGDDARNARRLLGLI
jgi:transcriptional regulator with XRE-family HTH domain